MSKELKVTVWLLSIGVVLTTLLIIGLVLLLSDDQPVLSTEPQWLYVPITASISEIPTSDGLFADPNQRPPSTTELSRSIREAGLDDDILGIRMEIKAVAMGWGQLQEIRDALAEFRTTGKECKVWAEGYGNKEYYLATACNEISLPPAGFFLVNGLSMSTSYYAEMFEMLDIRANFAHVGDFKSAVEPYERSGPSQAASEAREALLDHLFDEFVAGIAIGRELSDDAVKINLDNPPITPDGALKDEWVDQLVYRDEFLLKDKEDFQLLHLNTYTTASSDSGWNNSPKVAVITVDGAIMSGSSGQSLLGGTSIGDQTFRRYVERAIDENVSAIVLRVSSPGGSGSASDAIWNDLQRLKRMEIPIVVSMGDYAASGGYYIAMAGDYIFAHPSTITGSIGVFGGKFNLNGLFKKGGVTNHTSSRGAYANLFSLTSDFTENERKKYQNFLDSFYDVFITKAASSRNLSKESLHKVAQGRVWTGVQALEHGLIDELGGLNNAVDKAKELSGIQQATIVQIPTPLSFWEQILEDLNRPTDEASLAAQSQINLWQQLSPSILSKLPQANQDQLANLESIWSIINGSSIVAMNPVYLSID